MIRPDGVPAEAEAFDAIAHLKTQRAPSKLIEGLEQLEARLICPRCKRERLLTFQKFNCAGCGLAMQRGSTALWCWEEEPGPLATWHALAKEREHA